jgi:hypothetical protein
MARSEMLAIPSDATALELAVRPAPPGPTPTATED